MAEVKNKSKAIQFFSRRAARCQAPISFPKSLLGYFLSFFLAIHLCEYSVRKQKKFELDEKEWKWQQAWVN